MAESSRVKDQPVEEQLLSRLRDGVLWLTLIRPARPKTHVATIVAALHADRDIRVINAATGELLHHLTLSPHTDYQPQPQSKT